ncbi:MAG: hypothetical protein K2M69_01810 [Muribaculaceae bacterium]|nr:hypothetical protein [Muribaculaceae bacterium]
MANLGSLFYTMGIRDLTDADLQKINKKLEKAGSTIKITPEMVKPVKDLIPKGLKLELDPELKKLSNEALEKAAEGKTMKVAIAPLLTGFREAIIKATKDNPPSAEIGVQETKLRSIIQNVLNKQGFMLNVSTVNDNYSKAIQQKLNGRKYTVTIHADAKEIARSVQASLMQVQSRYFGLQVSKDILRNSIDNALMGKPFNIQIAVMPDQARRAVQNALNNARMVGKDDALAYQRLQTGELRAAQAELARLKAAQQGASEAAKAHTSASVNLGGALGSNIKIAGELGSVMASLYSIHAAKQFLSQVIEIGGELEHQKIALETIYGSESKMESLYGQIKGLARQSPFGVMELTKNIKQLSAYGVAYNEVYDTAKRLADISAATSVDIQRLILAFGKTKNRTFLDGLEAKQFAYANIPIYDMLSKKLTELEGKFVSVKDVMGRIKKREIGFDMVKDILWDMTDAGGKFYNMQEKLAGSVKTSWKLVRDNIELMFGEIAESSVGSGLKSVAELLQGITREWKTLASVVGAGAIAFGVYKTAVLAHNVVAGQSLTIAARQHASLKMARYHANLAAQSYRMLTQAEEENYLASSGLAKIKGINVLWSKKLTVAEVDALVAKKLLTKEDLLRLVALRKVSTATAEAVLITKNMEAADIAETRAQIARAAAAKRSAVMWGQVKASMAGTVSSLLSFAKISLPLIALGAVVGLITKWHEKAQKIKELSNDLSKKGFDGYEGMAKQLKDLDAFDVNSASSAAINSKIEEMKTTLKDYSLTAEDTFRTVFGPDADGKIMSQREQFEALRQAIQDTANAYKRMQNGNKSSLFNSDSAKALDKAGKNYDKSVSDTAEAYGKILDNVENIEKEFAAIEVRVRSSSGQSAYKDIDATLELRKQLQGLATIEERLQYLDNYTPKRGYVDTHKAENISNYISALRQQALAEKKAQNQTSQYIKYLENTFKAYKPNFSLATATREEKEVFLQEAKAFIDSREDWGEQMKRISMDMAYEAVGIDSSRISEMYDNLFKDVYIQLGPELAQKVKDGLELSDEEKSKVDTALKLAYNKLFKDAPEWQQKALNKAFTFKGKDGKVQWDNSKIEKLKVRMQVIPELEDWQQQIYKELGGNPVIKTWLKGTPDTQSFVKAAQDGYKTAREGLDKLKPLAIKAGLNLNFNLSQLKRIPMVTKQYADASPEVRKMIDEYNEFVDAINAAQKAGAGMGFDPAAEYNKGHKEKKDKGSQKDPFADAIKERIKILKEAKKEYDDLAKSIGSEAAFNKLKDSPIFKGLEANKYLPEQSVPRNIEEYKSAIDELQNLLTQKGLQTQKHRELNIEIEKLKFDIEKGEINEALKTALSKVSKEAERQLADWNLFDKIRKATGNQDLAMSIAFGMNATAETDYPAMVKKQFADLAKELGHDLTFDNTSLEEAKKLGDEIEKSYKETADKLEKYAREQKDAIADILNEYQSLSDKLVKIDADRERKIKTVKKSDMSDADKAKYIQRINVEADYQKFTQSNEYLRFFNDIYGLTLSEANKIGDLIQLNLNQKLQAGLITIYDYEKEMEKVRKQLDAIRNVRSNTMTFLTGGLKGLNELQLKKEEGKLANDEGYQNALKEQISAQEALNKAKEEGNEEAIKAAEEQLELANQSVKAFTKIRDAIIEDKEKMQNIVDAVNIANSIAQGMSDAFNTLRDMADSFGFDTDSNAWNTAAAVMDTLTTVTGGVQKTLQSLMNGDIGGVISGAFDTLLTPVTIWSKLHDKKLDKMIEKSKEAAQIMQNQYDLLEKQMANFLGNAALMNTGTLGGGYGKQRELMQGQLSELGKQRQAEIDKKKTDNSVVEDYNQQIEEMKIAIRDFAIEAANDLYGIDLNGWAEQLGDALVDAFAAGEDAAEAFDKTVGDIMRDVTSKMISQDILAPMFGNLRDYLFGSDGMSGAFGSDFQLDPSEMGAMKEYLDKIKNEGIPAAQELFDAINEATAGMLNDTEKSKDGMTKGLQSLTENTGDLLASYLNAVRGDTAAMRLNWDKLMESMLPQINIIAEAQLIAQRQIAENTLRTAEAAEAIRSAMSDVTRNQDRLERSWRRIAEKNWGTY